MDWSTKVNYLIRNPVTVSSKTHYVFKQLLGKVILSGMHPKGEIMNFDDWREFQNSRWVVHIVDARKIDENEVSEVVEFIDKYITCDLLDQSKYPAMRNLVNKVQTLHHATACRKKKGVACRFNALWAPSDKTRIVCSEGNFDETIASQIKKFIEKTLSYIAWISDQSNVTLSEILEEHGVKQKSIRMCEKKVSILFKRKSCEVNITPCI